MTPAETAILVSLACVMVMQAILLRGQHQMSQSNETINDALTKLRAAYDADRTVNAKFRADVATALAALKNTTLDDAQQAIVNGLLSDMGQDTTDTTGADAALNPPTTEPPAAA